MNATLISTQKGKKTAPEAFTLLRHVDQSATNKVAILTRLADTSPFFAQEAAGWIKNCPRLQNEDKLQRTAEEILSGRPIGEKRYTTEEAYLHFFRKIPTGSRVQITFKKDAFDQLEEFIRNTYRYVVFSGDDRTMIQSCVLPTKRWESIPRTHSVLVQTQGAGAEMIAHYLFPCAESVQVLYTQVEFDRGQRGLIITPDKQALTQQLNNHPDVQFDKDLFMETIQELDYTEALDWLGNFDANEPLSNVLDRFESDYGRLQFFKLYALKFEQFMEA